MEVKDIAIDKIVVGKNVRSEPEQDLGGLMESIERYGVLQPILVIQRKGGTYELVAGHRRLAAMKARHERTIPAMVGSDLAARDITYVKLTENIQRKDMSPLELVQAFDALKVANPGLTLTAIGKMLGKSETWVADQYRIATTYDELRAGGMTDEEIRSLTKRDLKDLGRVKDPVARLDAARELRPRDKRALLGAHIKDKRGGFVDRSGGFAIMGGMDSNVVRVSCESKAARRDVISCLLDLKSRRVKRA